MLKSENVTVTYKNKKGKKKFLEKNYFSKILKEINKNQTLGTNEIETNNVLKLHQEKILNQKYLIIRYFY